MLWVDAFRAGASRACTAAEGLCPRPAGSAGAARWRPHVGTAAPAARSPAARCVRCRRRNPWRRRACGGSSPAPAAGPTRSRTPGAARGWWGGSAVPWHWRRAVHGWPGMAVRHLVSVGILTAQRGTSDPFGWPMGERVESFDYDYTERPSRTPPVRRRRVARHRRGQRSRRRRRHLHVLARRARCRRPPASRCATTSRHS